MPFGHPGPSLPPRIVVLGSGHESAFGLGEGATERAAGCLAQALLLPHRPIAHPQAPQRWLGQLHDTSGGWLASLPLDPGQPLPDGSTWAEALGAWRQPALLIIAAPQLASGAAASTTALLRQWGVPLLGLAQWGGTWDGERRRRDGLPWLGRMEEGAGSEGGDSAAELAERLQWRWACLDLPSPLPSP